MPFFPPRVRTVFRKELRESFRDRRVIISVIVSPLLFTPLLILFMGFTFGEKQQAAKSEQLVVAVVDPSAQLPAVEAKLRANHTLRVRDLPDRTAAERAIHDRIVRAALLVDDNAQEALTGQESTTVHLLVDDSSEKSRNARDRLQQAVRDANDELTNQRLAAHQLTKDFIHPLKIQSENLASKSSMSGFILGIILPYIIILSAAFGGMTAAFDLCAGEKERGTLETLLVSPASRREIIVGKLLTIGVISMLAAACSVTGLVGAVKIGLHLAKHSVGDVGNIIAINTTTVGWLVLALLPLVLMTSALLLIVSTIARNPKEAQAYIFPFMLIVMLPAMLSFVLGPENHLLLSLVPVLNTVLVMKQVLNNLFNWPFMALSLLSSLLYAAVSMRFVLSLFNRESVLFRT